MTTAEREPLVNLASDDTPLVPATKILTGEPISVLSRVFDTLVWRVVREPVDAFLLLGQRSHDEGHLASRVSLAVAARGGQEPSP